MGQLMLYDRIIKVDDLLIAHIKPFVTSNNLKGDKNAS